MLKDMISKIKIKLSEEGISGAFKAIIRRFYVTVFEYEVSIKHINHKNFSNDFRLIELNSELLDCMSAEYSDEITTKNIKEFQETLLPNATNACYLVLDNNNICGYYHIAFGEGYDSCVNYIIPNEVDDIYLFNDYTFKKHRGKGSHSFSIYSRLLIGKDMGYSRARVHIIKGNTFSEKAYLKFGFVKCKKISMVKFLGLKRTFVRNISISYSNLDYFLD